MEKTDLAILANSFVSSQNNCVPIRSANDNFSTKPHPQRERILEYLKSFEFSWISSQCVVDRKNGQHTNIAEKFYNDGKFEWSESDIFHFEKYNLILNEEFTNHILV